MNRKPEKFFRVIQSEDQDGRYVCECFQCNDIIDSSNPKYIICHYILCSEISFYNLLYFMIKNNDNLPLLARSPPPNCTTPMAKLLFQNKIDRHMIFKMLPVDDRHDLSSDYCFTRYLLAKNKVKKRINNHEILRKEADEAKTMLNDFLVENNILFSYIWI